MLHPLSRKSNSTSSVRLKVLQTYTFTKSQTMKVAVTTKPEGMDLPALALLKIYDRRYLEERTFHNKAKRFWNYDKELLAAHVENAIIKYRKQVPYSVKHSFTVDDVKPDLIIFADDDLEEEELEAVKDLDEKAVDQYRIEKWYRDTVMRWFRHESRAYFQLQKLQGQCIPEFYGTTTFDFDSSSSMPPGILPEVPGVLIQFIDGTILDELFPDSKMAITFPHIGETAVECVRQLALHGILHGDIRLPNFIVRGDGRLFVFDFGFAKFREKDVTDDEWKEKVAGMEEELLIKTFLDEKGLRDKTPPEPYIANRYGYRLFNREIEKSRDCWVNTYYESVDDPDDFEFREDDNGKEYVFDLPNWKLKQDAVNKRKTYMESLNSLALDE
jgi:serine/threonine protein kinase